jgi:hypothetical protein
MGRGWGLIQFPEHLPAGAQILLDCAFMACLGVPVGLLAPRRLSGAAVAALVVAGALALPPWIGLAPTPPLQIASLVLGVALAACIP